MPFENTVTPKVGHADSSETTISVHWTKQSDYPGEVRIQAQRTMVEQCSPVMQFNSSGRPGYTYDDIVNGTTPKPKTVPDFEATPPEIWDEMPTKAQYDAATKARTDIMSDDFDVPTCSCGPNEACPKCPDSRFPIEIDARHAGDHLPRLNTPDDLTADVLSFVADAIILLNIDEPSNKNWSADDLLGMVSDLKQWEGWVTPKTVVQLRRENFLTKRERRLGVMTPAGPVVRDEDKPDNPYARSRVQAKSAVNPDGDIDSTIQSKVMDRADINRTIAALRRARDQAYGKDQ